jgi:hypothetical protein
MGNDPRGFRAFIAWGQLYEAAEGNPATNTRVHLRGLQAWILSRRDETWRRVQDPGPIAGSAYTEDFAGDVNRPADVRDEPSGGISVTAGDGFNFHFWPVAGRIPIDPEDVGGVFTTCQARLVLEDPAGRDDRATARYVLSIGADYWASLDAVWDQWRTNGDVGIGKFKYVTTEWRAFNMTSVAADELRRNPPPVE